MALPQLERLVAVMARLRLECPWDAEQTHLSLVPYLLEEVCETVEAIEAGSAEDLREELGDLLLQVVFHAAIAAEADPAVDLDAVAGDVADKLVARHPYVFAGAEVPADLLASWEQRKAVEKGRRSALDGIPERLSALSRASKIIHRARSHDVGVDLPDEPIAADELGRALLALVARGQAHGIDAEQAARDAVRELELSVRSLERPAGPLERPVRSPERPVAGAEARD